MKKLLPTSTAGSLPKPSWLAEPEKLWSPWKLENEGLAEGKKRRVTFGVARTTACWHRHCERWRTNPPTLCDYVY